jgi:hypothetical protein
MKPKPDIERLTEAVREAEAELDAARGRSAVNAAAKEAAARSRRAAIGRGRRADGAGQEAESRSRTLNRVELAPDWHPTRCHYPVQEGMAGPG